MVSAVGRYNDTYQYKTVFRKEEEGLDPPSKMNLQYIFQHYSYLSYKAMGANPSYTGTDRHFRLMRLQEFKTMIQDFGIDFDVESKKLENRFAKLAVQQKGSAMQVPQIDLNGLVTLLFDVFKYTTHKDQEFQNQVALHFTRGDLNRSHLIWRKNYVWFKIKESFHLDSRKWIKERLQEIKNGSVPAIENNKLEDTFARAIE